MTYTKLGDEFSAIAEELSDGAFRLHIEALIWSSSMLLDLRIPKRQVRRFAATSAIVSDCINELIEAGWWEDLGDAWGVGCRFPEWQMTREWVEHQQERNRRKVAAHRKRKAAKDSVPLTAGVPNPAQPNPTHVTGDVTGNSADEPDPEAASETDSLPVLSCCDEPELTTWGKAIVCRTCGTRAAG